MFRLLVTEGGRKTRRPLDCRNVNEAHWVAMNVAAYASAPVVVRVQRGPIWRDVEKLERH